MAEKDNDGHVGSNGKPAKKRRLTKKQAKLIKAIVDPNVPTIAKAGEIAGYTSRQHTHKAVQGGTVQEVLENFLSKLTAAGVTDEHLARRIKEGLDATETKFFAHEGTVVDQRECVDYYARHKYIETVSKIRKLISGGGEEGGSQKQQLILIIGEGGLAEII
jgi:hypothetical protein